MSASADGEEKIPYRRVSDALNTYWTPINEALKKNGGDFPEREMLPVECHCHRIPPVPISSRSLLELKREYDRPFVTKHDLEGRIEDMKNHIYQYALNDYVKIHGRDAFIMGMIYADNEHHRAENIRVAEVKSKLNSVRNRLDSLRRQLGKRDYPLILCKMEFYEDKIRFLEEQL